MYKTIDLNGLRFG